MRNDDTTNAKGDGKDPKSKARSILENFSKLGQGLLRCADGFTKLSGAIVVLFAIALFFSERIANETKIQISQRFGATGAVKYLIADEVDLEGNVEERRPWSVANCI